MLPFNILRFFFLIFIVHDRVFDNDFIIQTFRSMNLTCNLEGLEIILKISKLIWEKFNYVLRNQFHRKKIGI